MLVLRMTTLNMNLKTKLRRFIDRNTPFTGVEFRLQHDPITSQLCVLCSRRTTQKMFYDM